MDNLSTASSKPAFIAAVAARNGMMFPAFLDPSPIATIAHELSDGTSIERVAAAHSMHSDEIESALRKLWDLSPELAEAATKAGNRARKFAARQIDDIPEALLIEYFRQCALEWKAYRTLSAMQLLEGPPIKYMSALVEQMDRSDIAILFELPPESPVLNVAKTTAGNVTTRAQPHDLSDDKKKTPHLEDLVVH